MLARQIVFNFNLIDDSWSFKFDLAVKWVKVTRGSLFEYTMMGWSPRCYIQNFVKIGLPVLEKNFEGFLTYMSMAAFLVM